MAVGVAGRAGDVLNGPRSHGVLRALEHRDFKDEHTDALSTLKGVPGTYTPGQVATLYAYAHRPEDFPVAPDLTVHNEIPADSTPEYIPAAMIEMQVRWLPRQTLLGMIASRFVLPEGVSRYPRWTFRDVAARAADRAARKIRSIVGEGQLTDKAYREVVAYQELCDREAAYARAQEAYFAEVHEDRLAWATEDDELKAEREAEREEAPRVPLSPALDVYAQAAARGHRPLF